jgi:putative N6-adenine-specific DNA methylase
MSKRLYATTNPGFEDILTDEITDIGGTDLERTKGGVEFSGDPNHIYRSLAELRTANRVLVRLGTVEATTFDELRDKIRQFEWEKYFDSDQKLAIKAHSHRSRLYHTGGIEERIRKGIADRLASDAPKEADSTLDGDQYLLARFDNDRCQLSLAANTTLLHKRGWRQKSGRAPIRETLAAAILELSEWSPGEPLLDPMCGSGTFVIEAARRQLSLPPTCDTNFSARAWPALDENLWREISGETQTSARSANLFGSDISGEMIEIATKNAKRANVGEATSFSQADAAEVQPPVRDPGYVFSNPPYGTRLDIEGKPPHEQLIEQFGQHFDDWRLLLILPSKILPSHAKLMFEEILSFENGGLDVKLWRGVHF